MHCITSRCFIVNYLHHLVCVECFKEWYDCLLLMSLDDGNILLALLLDTVGVDTYIKQFPLYDKISTADVTVTVADTPGSMRNWEITEASIHEEM